MRNRHSLNSLLIRLALSVCLSSTFMACSSYSGWKPEDHEDPEVRRNQEAAKERASKQDDQLENLDPATLKPGDRVWITTDEGERFNTKLELINVDESWLRVGFKDAWYMLGQHSEAEQYNLSQRVEYFFEELVVLTYY